MSYKKLMMMMVISFIIMYAVMFFNVNDIKHIYLSTARFYMAILMVAPMAVVMLLMMNKMYPNKKMNSTIIISTTTVFFLTLVLLRTQTPIGDKAYMKAMIPHHSSAILTSKHADIKDPEVRELADQIIESQEKEIAQMEKILERMK